MLHLLFEGVTSRVQTAVFETLRAWLQAGEIDANMIAQTRLFQFTFEALANIELFDAAVDVICDMIHETQEVEDNVQVVEMIVPKVIALRPVFDQAVKDEEDDAVRGYCRIFTEAGETYRQLILAHPDTFLPLVEAIGQCAAYHDLDIVPITFGFWWKFGQALGKRARQDDRYDEEEDAGPSSNQHQAVYGPFLQVYANLQDSMIRHLQFPQGDNAGFTNAAARDEFRAFRHDMGDTLKDCCAVLGANVCMKRSYDLVMAALAKGDAMLWQEVEAPLFSMRSMGAEVDPSDDEVLPHIMDMLPTLPRHPKIQYAAILVISRYTQWINEHPSYLSFQLNYISSGFEIQTDDVAAAAAQAMKWMCKDCKEHLVPYLGQLYTFITTAGTGLEIDDRIEVTEAIGYVISIMSPNDAAEALQRFTQPILQQIQTLGAGPILQGREELTPLTGMSELSFSYTQADLRLYRGTRATRGILGYRLIDRSPSCFMSKHRGRSISGPRPANRQILCIILRCRPGLQCSSKRAVVLPLQHDSTDPASAARTAQSELRAVRSPAIYLDHRQMRWFIRQTGRGARTCGR